MAAEKYLKEQKAREKLERKLEKKRQKERRSSSVRSGSLSLGDEEVIVGVGGGGGGNDGLGGRMHMEQDIGMGLATGTWGRRESQVSGSSGGSDAGNGAGIVLGKQKADYQIVDDGGKGWDWRGSRKSESGLFASLRRASKGREPRIV